MQSFHDETTKKISDYPRRITRSVIVDIGLILISYAAVFFVRVVTISLNFTLGTGFLVFIVVTMIVSLYGFGAYHRLWDRSSGHEIALIFKAVIVATLIICAAALLMTPRPLPLSVILVANALVTSGLIAIRYRSRLITGLSWRWKAIWKREFPTLPPRKRVLVIGAGESGQTLALRLKHRFPGNEYEVVGFVDDDPDKQHMYVEGCPVLGTRYDIERIAQTHNLDLIVVALHNVGGADFREILSLCEKTSALIKVVPNLLNLVSATSQVPLLRNVEPEDLIGRKPISRSKDVDLAPVTHKVILVTGAAGSIGSELSRQIAEYHPVKLILLDNNESGLHDLVTEVGTRFPDVDLMPVLADITRNEHLESIFRDHRPQVVFHAAAYKHVPMLESYPYEALRVNIGGTIGLARLAATFKTERFVLISTDKAVKPSSVMGASKRICELFLHAISQQRDHCTIFTSVRFGNVLGSRGSVIPTFSRQIESGGPVTVTHPDMTRYFMSIPEAVNLIIHAACLTKGDDIYMLRMGEVVRIVELAERMIRMHGLRPNKDICIEFTGIRPGEKMHEELHDEFEVPLDTVHPNIVQLKSWQDHFDTTQFMQRLEAALKRAPASQAETLAMLHEMMQPDKNDSFELQSNIARPSIS